MTHPYSGPAEASVTQEVVAHLVLAGEPPVSLPAELRYDRADPCAVRLSVGTMSADPVDWVFARSLLSAGMSRPVGVGDILVIPQRDRPRRWVRIVIRPLTGAAVLDIDAAAVAAFLERTCVVVPPGTEGRHIDLDRLVAELLAGSGGGPGR